MYKVYFKGIITYEDKLELTRIYNNYYGYKCRVILRADHVIVKYKGDKTEVDLTVPVKGTYYENMITVIEE
jgi:hypothetical protein